MTADGYIKQLGLTPHPEGGYFKETYRAAAAPGERAASTGIYFLLEQDDVSHIHKIDADEMWHFYACGPLRVHMITPEGDYSYFTLGADVRQ